MEPESKLKCLLVKEETMDLGIEDGTVEDPHQEEATLLVGRAHVAETASVIVEVPDPFRAIAFVGILAVVPVRQATASTEINSREYQILQRSSKSTHHFLNALEFLIVVYPTFTPVSRDLLLYDNPYLGVCLS